MGHHRTEAMRIPMRGRRGKPKKIQTSKVKWDLGWSNLHRIKANPYIGNQRAIAGTKSGRKQSMDLESPGFLKKLLGK